MVETYLCGVIRMAENTAAVKRSRVCKHGGKLLWRWHVQSERLQWREVGGLIEREWVAVTEMV